MTPGSRLATLDLLRGLAVIGMVETHIVNVGLQPALRNPPAWPVLNGLNGLVAPLFLFVTGFLLEMSPVRSHAALVRRLQRFGRWLLIALWLHLPVVDPVTWHLDLTPCAQFDILDCLAVSGAILTVAQRWRCNGTAYAGTLGLVLACTVLLDRLHFMETAPSWCKGFFVHCAWSRFPLFPWLTFLLAGALFFRIIDRRDGTFDRSRLPMLVAVPLAGAVVLHLLLISGMTTKWTFDLRADPIFALGRLSTVAALLGFALWIRPSGIGWLNWLGRRSLPLYAIHLFLLFTSFPAGHSFSELLAGRLDWLGVALVSGALLAISGLLLLTLERLRPVQNPLGEVRA